MTASPPRIETPPATHIFARAGAEFESDIELGDVHHSMNTAFMFVGMRRWLDFRRHEPEKFAARGRDGAAIS